MGYVDREKKNEYAREWVARRKAAWFAGKSCVVCGSTENLELDHIDPATKSQKLKDSSGTVIWSWSEERLIAELAKCQVLCHDCHLKKTLLNRETGNRTRGSSRQNAKLTDDDIREIRRRIGNGETHRAVAKMFNISHVRAGKIYRREAWAHVV